MMSPGSGALRLTRALSLALAAYGLSFGAHLVCGGHTPSPLASAVLLLLTSWMCVLVTWRRLGKTAIVGLLGLSQVALHEGLTLASSAHPCLTVAHTHLAHVVHAGMDACPGAAVAGISGLPPMPAEAHHGSPGVAMVFAHASAALLLALILARGEAALWSLASLVWPAWPDALVSAAVRRSPGVLSARPRAWAASFRPGGVGRRGPPTGCVPAAP